MLISVIQFSVMESAGYIAMARKAGVTIRERDTIFTIEGALAFACVRMVHSRYARLCGCFVAPGYRNKGYGKALVLHRLEFIECETSAVIVDTYARRKNLFLSLGFNEIAGYKIGTTLLRKRLHADS